MFPVLENSWIGMKFPLVKDPWLESVLYWKECTSHSPVEGRLGSWVLEQLFERHQHRSTAIVLSALTTEFVLVLLLVLPSFKTSEFVLVLLLVLVLHCWNVKIQFEINEWKFYIFRCVNFLILKSNLFGKV